MGVGPACWTSLPLVFLSGSWATFPTYGPTVTTRVHALAETTACSGAAVSVGCGRFKSPADTASGP